MLPHVSAGVGYAIAGVADRNLLYLGERETLDGMTDRGPVASFGAGVEVQVGNGVGVFGATRYLRVFTDPQLTAFMPFTLGVSLRLEER